MKKELGYKHDAAVPKIRKVVLNSGVGRIVKDEKAVEAVAHALSLIAGQHAVLTKAKKSIASFKTRQGMPIGVMVCLRGDRMYHFMDRLVSVALPRTKDFHGIDARCIDDNGNLTMGIRESIVFPEVSYEKAGQIFGFQATFVTNCGKKASAEQLFRLMGFPLKKK